MKNASSLNVTRLLLFIFSVSHSHLNPLSVDGWASLDPMSGAEDGVKSRVITMLNAMRTILRCDFLTILAFTFDSEHKTLTNPNPNPPQVSHLLCYAYRAIGID